MLNYLLLFVVAIYLFFVIFRSFEETKKTKRLENIQVLDRFNESLGDIKSYRYAQ